MSPILPPWTQARYTHEKQIDAIYLVAGGSERYPFVELSVHARVFDNVRDNRNYHVDCLL